MSQSAKTAPVPATALPDPNALQARASDPAQSVWVGASAGSGKTKVLTDRVLRLLLPRRVAGQLLPGTPAGRILCLTFTKAGAAEMAGRITGALAEWAVTPEDKLHDSLTKLLTRPPEAAEVEAARRLFAQVIDTPGGLKILTIHSFCQSVLGRFPLEAGLSPNIGVADETAIRPLQQAALSALLREAESPEAPLHHAVARLSREKGEDDLMTLLGGLMKERGRLAALLRAFPEEESLNAPLSALLGVGVEETAESVIFRAVNGDLRAEAALRQAVAVMAASPKKTMQANALPLQALLDAAADGRVALYPDYRKVFLTNEGTIRAKLATQDIPAEIAAILEDEAARLYALEDRLLALACRDRTVDLLRAGAAMMRHYTAEKNRHAVLDYDDLIAHTLALLKGESMNIDAAAAAQWVMFKLDQGIDHILVDEAQDTNPEQWDIINALCGEFFAGAGTQDEKTRSIFAVGDEKQSIFGFQRAAPEKFREAGQFYQKTVTDAGQAFDPVPMNISFRSAAAILALTDAVFDDGTDGSAERLLGLRDGEDIRHFSFRAGQEGIVELWPLIRETPTPDPVPWTPPVEIEDAPGAESILCNTIAAKIRHWIDSGEILPAYGRAVEPGDIMILVKSRNSLVERMVRALKSANIPVSGVDRMVLPDQIAVQDMLAAAQFALLPEDDLSLACLLKSPLIGMDEDGLARIAIGRAGSLWQAVRKNADEKTTQWLEQLMGIGGTLHPYEFFARLLALPCPANSIVPQNTGISGGSGGLHAMCRRLGVECLDPLEEFLNLCLRYEGENIPSLQGFLNWQATEDTAIKREMEAAGGHVRIMTVHGSKGLQSPIVILPDTAHTGAAIEKTGLAERILWVTGEDGPDLPVWSPRKEDDCRLTRAAVTAKKAKLAEEYRRLFYVALTRAADRLYIAGCAKKYDPSPECWYRLAEQGFARMEKDRPAGYSIEPLSDIAAALGADGPGFRLHNPQTQNPDRAKKSDVAKQEGHQPTPALPALDDWSWSNTAPAEEESPPRPWTPSRPSDPEPAARSPLSGADDSYRFRRGNVTHSLLQFLPGLPREGWEKAARHYTAGQDVSEDVQNSIVLETMTILNHPDFAAVFGPGSMAEVPVTALINGVLISGQIDRLLVTDNSILIVDYKTNRPPPRNVKDIPPAYRTQLKAYRDVLEKIYPGRAIRCALLWTDGPFMMEVPV